MKKEKNNDKIKVAYDKLTNREENVVAIFETMKTKISAAGQSTVQKAKELSEIHLLGTEYTIPTLREVLELVGGKVPLLIELKGEKVSGPVTVAPGSCAFLIV